MACKPATGELLSSKAVLCVSRSSVKQVQGSLLTGELSRVGSLHPSTYLLNKSNRTLWEAERSEDGLNCGVFGSSVNTAGAEVPSRSCAGESRDPEKDLGPCCVLWSHR